MKVQHASVAFKDNLKSVTFRDKFKSVTFRDEFKSVTFRDDLKSVTFKNDLSKTSKENTLTSSQQPPFFFFFSLPLSFLDTFALLFLELMALAVVALVPALFFGTTADTLEVPVAAVGTGTGASLLMLPLLLSPWWGSCTVARPLHLCCQKSWILVWRQLLWLFGSLCVKT